MNMSKHFSFEEFTKTNTGLPNLPNDEEIKAGKLLAINILEPVRAWARTKKPNAVVIPSSWFRSKAVNMAIGSKATSTSQHLFGEAVDFEIPGIPNDEIWNFINECLDFDQLIAEKLTKRNGSDGWIHVSYRRNRLRHDAISYLGGKDYRQGLHYVE